MSVFSSERYPELYGVDLFSGEDTTTVRMNWGSILEHGSVGLYKVKRILSGDYLEIEGFPVWTWQREATRAKRIKPTEDAQRNQNEKDARKKITRLMNANFTPSDISITLSYAGEQPGSLEQARRDVQNYLRRVKRWREAHGLPEIKYIYVIEYVGEDGRKQRAHHHIVMSEMDRDEAEKIWQRGRANSKRLKPDEYGLEALARYFIKTKGHRAINEKAWAASRNLKKPKVTFSEKKISKRDVERVASNEAMIRDLLQRRERGFIVTDVTVHRSEYVAGAYIYARLRRVKPAKGLTRGSKANTGPDTRTRNGGKPMMKH
jgi:hypothetical protein